VAAGYLTTKLGVRTGSGVSPGGKGHPLIPWMRGGPGGIAGKGHPLIPWMRGVPVAAVAVVPAGPEGISRDAIDAANRGRIHRDDLEILEILTIIYSCQEL